MPDIVMFNVTGNIFSLMGTAIESACEGGQIKICQVVRPDGGGAAVSFHKRGSQGGAYYPVIFIDTNNDYVRKNYDLCADHVKSIFCKNIMKHHLIITICYDSNTTLMRRLRLMQLNVQPLTISGPADDSRGRENKNSDGATGDHVLYEVHTISEGIKFIFDQFLNPDPGPDTGPGSSGSHAGVNWATPWADPERRDS